MKYKLKYSILIGCPLGYLVGDGINLHNNAEWICGLIVLALVTAYMIETRTIFREVKDEIDQIREVINERKSNVKYEDLNQERSKI